MKHSRVHGQTASPSQKICKQFGVRAIRLTCFLNSSCFSPCQSHWNYLSHLVNRIGITSTERSMCMSTAILAECTVRIVLMLVDRLCVVLGVGRQALHLPSPVAS